MKRNNGRVWAALQAVLLAAAIGIGVWYLVGRCDGPSDMRAFADSGTAWAGVLDTGVMLLAGALLAFMLSRADYALGLNGHCARGKSRETGD